jgi:hypothetical protein
MHKKSFFRVILSNVIGVLFFILAIYLMNFLLPTISNPVYSKVVSFVNDNAAFMIVMSVIFAIGDLFFSLPFPINLPAPLFSSLGAVFLVAFVGRVFWLIGGLTDVDIIEAFRILSFILYPLAFLGTLIGGYISIFSALFSSGSRHEEKRREQNVLHAKRSPTWADVGDEFRNALFDFFSMLRRAFNKK